MKVYVIISEAIANGKLINSRIVSIYSDEKNAIRECRNLLYTNGYSTDTISFYYSVKEFEVE